MVTIGDYSHSAYSLLNAFVGDKQINMITVGSEIVWGYDKGDYEFIDYIESTGTQYIEIPYYINNNTYVEANICLLYTSDAADE